MIALALLIFELAFPSTSRYTCIVSDVRPSPSDVVICQMRRDISASVAYDEPRANQTFSCDQSLVYLEIASQDHPILIIGCIFAALFGISCLFYLWYP